MPIPFNCPHCGTSMTVDDKFAGQTGPCASCQQPITIPNSAGGTPPREPPKAGTVGTVLGIAVVGMLGLLMCGGVVAVLLLPAVTHTGGASRTVESRNNLKQIALALHNYHDANGKFPPAVVTDADGKPLYSWRVELLPYLELGHLYDRFDKTKAWDDPANLSVSNAVVEVFRSPLDDSLPPSGNSYFVLVGAKTLFPPDRGIGMAEVTDGTSNTIAVVELKGVAGSWAAPIDPKIEGVAMSIGPAPSQLNPTQADRLNVAMCDGSVRSLPITTPSHTLHLLFTRNDGMVVNIPDDP